MVEEWVAVFINSEIAFNVYYPLVMYYISLFLCLENIVVYPYPVHILSLSNINVYID